MLAIASSCCLALAASFQVQEEVTYADLLHELTDLTLRTEPPPPGTRTFQFSSYDRESLKGPADEKAWFANHDVGHFLRVEELDGGKEFVMAEVEGAGCLTRIWSANPKGDLLFFVDGSEEPTWRIPFQELCGGTREPFLEPLAGQRARGWNCHVPIPFARSLRLSCTEGGFYYHVNVRLYPAGTQLPSWSPAMLEEQRGALRAAAATLAEEDRLLEQADYHNVVGGELTDSEPLTLVYDGEGTILRLAVTRAEVEAVEPEELTRRLRMLRLRIRADAAPEPQVDVPLGDFFAVLPTWRPQRSRFFTIDDSSLITHLPIPFSNGCIVELVHDGNGQAGTFLLAGHSVAKASGTLRLHAAWRGARDVSTRPMQDWNVLDAEGPGWFVGCTLNLLNPVRAWWGEGDEKVYVDGETFPSTFGTGTEDYFGYAWCSPELFEHPLHQQSHCDGPGNYGYTTVARFHTLDAIAFQERLRFDLELWHWKECSVDYATTAYWYAPAAARNALPPLPPAEERLLRPVPERKVLRVAGALEGESLTVVEKTRGEARPQDMAAFGERWSGEEQLWWTGGQPGDRLSVSFELDEPFEGTLLARFTKARDYGVIAVSLDGEPVLERLDLYDPNVVPTDEIALGRRTLQPGTHRLTVEILGANDEAVPAHMVGLDYLRLEGR